MSGSLLLVDNQCDELLLHVILVVSRDLCSSSSLYFSGDSQHFVVLRDETSRAEATKVDDKQNQQQ